jgi:hypothetical protein
VERNPLVSDFSLTPLNYLLTAVVFENIVVFCLYTPYSY